MSKSRIERTLKDNNIAVVFLCTLKYCNLYNSYIEMEHQNIFLSQTLKLQLGTKFARIYLFKKKKKKKKGYPSVFKCT